jgi:hypothetical protein
MQNKRERELLCKAYSNGAASPRALLAGCAAGLCATATIAVAGMLTDPNPLTLAERSQNDRARVAVTQPATEHQRAVFVARQEQFAKRSGALPMYASATGVAPGR